MGTNEARIIGREVSYTRQAGYHCAECGADTIVYEPKAETVICGVCEKAGAAKAWDHMIRTEVTKELLPLSKTSVL